MVMNEMINGKIDNKNIGLVKNLWELRQALDVYCLISTNWKAIENGGVGKNFFNFLMMSCQHLIALYICKVFEKETDKRGKVKYELNSIDGVLRSLADDKPPVLDSAKVSSFVRKYSNGRGEDGTLLALSLTAEDFKTKYQKELDRFKTFRDKRGAHSEFGFDPRGLPSYDAMEQLFNFGWEFYSVISEAFISVGPCNLESSRQVRDSLKMVLCELGLEDIKTEME
jgi:hypothetical protein